MTFDVNGFIIKHEIHQGSHKGTLRNYYTGIMLEKLHAKFTNKPKHTKGNFNSGTFYKYYQSLKSAKDESMSLQDGMLLFRAQYSEWKY